MARTELFFSSSETESGPPAYRTPQCGRCGLHKGCKTPKMEIFGQGKRGILVYGEAPGQQEDDRGRPFVGPAGQELRSWLRDCGLDLDRDCWSGNALRCHPKGNEIKDERAVDYCRPFLIRAMEELKPNRVLLLGATAVKSMMTHLWKSDVGPITRWVGWQIPCQKYNCWVHPTYHPSFVLRAQEKKEGLILSNAVRSHTRAMMAKGDFRPWKEVPDYRKQVEVILDVEEAVKAIHWFNRRPIATAFDYETTTLKPDGPNAEIVSCSLSNGRRTVAFPWSIRVETAMKVLLANPEVRKIGSNNKFEDRWTRAKLGIGVKSWAWDTMLAAHALDGRTGITSIKFQAFVLLGQEDWSSVVDDYLKQDGGGNAANRIRHLEMSTLLEYNALDSLLEYKVVELQRKEFGRA